MYLCMYVCMCKYLCKNSENEREEWRTLSPEFQGPTKATWASIVTVTKTCMTCALADLQPI